jgi:hypothetical protein
VNSSGTTTKTFLSHWEGRTISIQAHAKRPGNEPMVEASVTPDLDEALIAS